MSPKPRRGGRRLDAATGIVFVALVLIAFILPGAPPKSDDRLARIVAFYSGHRSALLAASVLFGLAAIFFLWFLATLRACLREAGGGDARLSSVCFGGGVVAVALMLAAAGVTNGLAFDVAGRGDALLVRALSDVGNGLAAMSSFGFAAFLAGASGSAARSGALPRWLVWLGSVAAAFALAGGASLFAGHGVFQAGGAFNLVELDPALIWIVAASVTMMRRGDPAQPGDRGS